MTRPKISDYEGKTLAYADALEVYAVELESANDYLAKAYSNKQKEMNLAINHYKRILKAETEWHTDKPPRDDLFVGDWEGDWHVAINCWTSDDGTPGYQTSSGEIIEKHPDKWYRIPQSTPLSEDE